MNFIQVDIIGLSTSPSSGGAYALVLGEIDGNRRLPIIIGAFEAQAIALELEKIQPPRPMTHDLLRDLFEAVHAEVIDILIDELKEGTFFAKIRFTLGGEEGQLDARPSDAVALAVRLDAPVFVSPAVLDEAGIPTEDDLSEPAAAMESAGDPASESLEELEEETVDAPPKSRLEAVQAELDKAITEEDYERAARLRDEITKLKGGSNLPLPRRIVRAKYRSDMTSRPEDPAVGQRLAFDSLRGYSALFRAYCTRFDTLAPFFGRDWRRKEDLEASAREAAAHPHDRDILVRVLKRQAEWWTRDDASLASIERLADPESSVVVTGQQVGLYTGPLYAVLKAATTIRLARQLEKETGKAVIPVFWLGTEDHDFEEMSSIVVPSGDDLVRLRYDGHRLPSEGNLGSVGALRFTDAIDGLGQQLAELLPDTEFHGDLVEAVTQACAAGQTFRDAFANILRLLLPDTGLVLMSAEAPEFKRLSVPLWKREITDGRTLHAALAATTEKLVETFHAQVHLRPTNLFLNVDGSRLPIDMEGEQFHVRGTDQFYDQASLLGLLDAEPHRFSPNVVLRPLTQDWLLPTAAYVAGPGEVAYFAQYRPAYEWAGLPMPVIYPRVSATLVEPRIQRLLKRLDRPLSDFSGDTARLFSDLVTEQVGGDLESRFSAATETVNVMVEGLRGPVTGVDPSLAKTVEAAGTNIQREIDRLRDRVLRSERRRHDELKTQVDRVANALFPGGSPQERVISPLYFLAKFGPGFFVDLMERMDLDTSGHQVFVL